MRPWMVAAAAVAWFVFLLIAPVAPAPLAAAAYALASLVCHQIPARSFHYGSVQLPVCARCLGIYAGAAVGAIACAANTRRLGAIGPRAALAAGVLPVVVTVALEQARAWAPGNTIRAITGIVLGLAAAFVVVGGTATLHYDECAPPRPIAPGPRPPTPI